MARSKADVSVESAPRVPLAPPSPPFRRSTRLAGPTAGFVLLGLAVAVAGPTPLLFAPALALWAVVVTVKLGTRAVVTASMMAVAVTAPMNGLRAYRALAITDIFLVIAVLGLVAESVVARRQRPGLARGLWVGLAMVVLGGCLGTFFAVDPLSSLANLLRFGAAAAAPVLVLPAWAPDVRTLRRYTWFWVSGAVISGVLGLLAGGDASGRSAGLTTHPNHLAMISALGAGLALALAVSERGRAKWTATGMFAVLALTVVRAGSRAGLIALVATTVVVFARTRGMRPAPARRGKFALAFLGLALVAASLLATNVIELGQHNAIKRFIGDATSASSDRGRVPLLEAGLRSIGQHPVTGSGFEKALQAHNVYVQVWAAAGLLGLLGFLLLAWTTVRAGLLPERGNPRRLLATAFVAGYVGYLAAGTVQNFLWDRYLWLHVAVILWVGAAASGETAPVRQCA